MRYLAALAWVGVLFLPFIAAQPATSAQPTPYPVTARMYGDGVNYQHERPELGPIGSELYVPWGWLHTGPGEFNWHKLDEQLEAEDGLWVTLDGPEPVQVPKPSWVFIVISLWNPARVYLPDHVSDAVVWLDWGYCDPVPIPDYRDEGLRTAYGEFVTAFGQRYANDPRVNVVIIGSVGVDGEASLAKDWGDCQWSIAAKAVPGLEYAWGQWVVNSISMYRDAFPDKALFFPIATGGQARCYWADLCAEQDPPVGLKHNGMWYDIPDWESTGEPCCGSWTAIAQHPELDVIVESKADLGADDLMWVVYAGMSSGKPVGMSLHPGYLDRLPPGELRKFTASLGKSAATTPYAWVVFRGAEYPEEWCVSGKRTPHEFWARMLEGQILQGDAVPEGARDSWMGRQLGRGPIRVMLAPGFNVSRQCAVMVDWWDGTAEPWAVTWWDGAKWRSHQIDATGDGEWKVAVVGDMVVNPTQPVVIDGEPYVHRLTVVSWANLLNEPTATPTATATAVPTWTATATPCPTWTETVTPAPTATATPTRTIQEDIYAFETYLDGRLFAEWGGFWRSRVIIESAVQSYPPGGGQEEP